jgi:hypothetical protein
MRTSTVVLTAALLAGAGSVLWLRSQLATERTTSATLRARLAAAELRTAPTALAAHESQPAESEIAATLRVTKVFAETRPTDPQAPTQNDYIARQREMLKNPQYRKAMRDQQRQQIEFSFRDLRKVLNLTPEQTAAVFDLMADNSINFTELQWQRPPTKEELRARQHASEQQQRKLDDDLERLLGASNHERLQEFQRTLVSRQEVNMLRGELSGGADPLRDDQYASMLDIVAAEQQRMSREVQEYYASSTGTQPYDSARTGFAVAANRRIVESARSVLSPDQLRTIEYVYNRQRQQMETQDALFRIQAEEAIRQAREPAGN